MNHLISINQVNKLFCLRQIKSLCSRGVIANQSLAFKGIFRLSQRPFSYKPRIQMIFDNNDEFHIYHYEKGENMIKLLSRINVVFLCGNCLLLAFELSSPFFGWWHAISLCLGVGASAFYGGMLHYYSTRMIRNVYLKNDGETVRIQLFNAFFKPKEFTAKIVDIGYLEPSRIYNIFLAKHKLDQKLYINFKRNIYKHMEMEKVLECVFQGKTLIFPQSIANSKLKR